MSGGFWDAPFQVERDEDDAGESPADQVYPERRQRLGQGLPEDEVTGPEQRSEDEKDVGRHPRTFSAPSLPPGRPALQPHEPPSRPRKKPRSWFGLWKEKGRARRRRHVATHASREPDGPETFAVYFLPSTTNLLEMVRGSILPRALWGVSGLGQPNARFVLLHYPRDSYYRKKELDPSHGPRVDDHAIRARSFGASMG